MLNVRNLNISFIDKDSKQRDIVKNFTLNLEEGQILALIGQSGSGKSIIALSILGLLRQAKITGEVIFAGQNLLNLADEDLQKIRGKKIGFIFQDPNTALNPLHKIGKQIAEAIKIHHPKITKKDLKNQVIKLMHEVELSNLTNRLDAYPHQLSGGQKQRVMIAIAIANHPQLIIADEPTTGLDAMVQNEILKLLKKLAQDKKMAVLLISHNQKAISQIADKVQEIGAPIDYLRNLKSRQQNQLSEGKICEGATSEREILTVKNLNLFYQKFLALEDINFTLKSGENLGIIGESGSGKSSLALALVNLIKGRGQINFFNSQHSQLNWDKDSRELRKLVQIVFQDPFSSLNPRMKIAEIVAEGLRIHKIVGDESAKLTAIFQKLKLDLALLDMYPHQLSGGQRQRVALARSLVLQPQILILDEPTSALDFTTQIEILNLLIEVQNQQPISYIVISHDLELVAKMCDKIAVLKSGRIVELQDSKTLFLKPQNEYSKTLVALARNHS